MHWSNYNHIISSILIQIQFNYDSIHHERLFGLYSVSPGDSWVSALPQ